jgi:RimJ/RimL family protein N-acetyltransferase
MTEFELRSARLRLRRLRPDDAAAIVAYRSRPDVARFQSWDGYCIADAERLIRDQASIVPDTPGTWLQLAIVSASSSEVAGDCGIHFLLESSCQVELGITLSPDYQGRGLATETVATILAYVFGTLEKRRVVAVTDAANASAARLFSRLGFRREAHFVDSIWFKGAWGSEYFFAMLRREWEERATRFDESPLTDR